MAWWADIITFGPFKYADSKYVTIIPVPGQEPFEKIHSCIVEKKKLWKAFFYVFDYSGGPLAVLSTRIHNNLRPISPYTGLWDCQ